MENSADRLPLILQGTRQTGKTFAMKEFGERRAVYFNFEGT
jgi:predicted AAA+ superfamily ATPase